MCNSKLEHQTKCYLRRGLLPPGNPLGLFFNSEQKLVVISQWGCRADLYRYAKSRTSRYIRPSVARHPKRPYCRKCLCICVILGPFSGKSNLYILPFLSNSFSLAFVLICYHLSVPLISSRLTAQIFSQMAPTLVLLKRPALGEGTVNQTRLYDRSRNCLISRT